MKDGSALAFCVGLELGFLTALALCYSWLIY